MSIIIWSEINWTNISQYAKNQYLEVKKQPKFMTDIVKNYLRLLEVISSLNFELETIMLKLLKVLKKEY